MRATLLALALAAFATSAYAQHETRYTNYATYENGDYTTEEFPEASVAYWLNGDRSRILVDNAANWDGSPPHAIQDNGAYTISLGNFMHPSITPGDVVHSRYINYVAGGKLELTETVTMVPWIRGPKTTALTAASLPPRPDSARFEWEGSTDTTSGLTGRWKLSWDSDPGVSYDVYVRYVDSVTPTGYSRMEYHRVAEGVTDDYYYFGETGEVTLMPGLGAIVVPFAAGEYGAFSPEATNFPPAPIYARASTANTTPWTAGVSWEYPGDESTITMYEIHRGDSANFVVGPASLLVTVPGGTRVYRDETVSQGERYFYRIKAKSVTGSSSEASNLAKCLIEEKYEGKPDLNVFYISRHPKYNRFNIIYEPGGFNPRPAPGTENWQHYPDESETMTYLAHIENTGGGEVDSFKIEWFVDSVLQRTDYGGSFFPDRHILSRFQLPWSSENPSYVRCEITAITPAPTEEITLQNNHIENRTNALGFDIHIEWGQYDNFREWKNKLGSYAFEDWIQFHMITFHRFFREAVYPHTPNGVDERVFIDSISYAPNGSLGGGTHAPVHWWADGAWGFNDNDEWFNIISTQHAQKGFDPGLMHELGHQLGLIDLYVTDVHGTTFSDDFVEPRTGEFPPLTPVVHFENPVYYYNSRASEDMMHGPGNARLSDHSAGGLQRNRSKRRGWYGEYQFDFSDNYAYTLTKPDGAPLANYKVMIYQKSADNIMRPPAKYIGSTDENGLYEFPHRTQPGYEGGIYTANPFSSTASEFPHVVGTNSALLIRVSKGDSVGYSFHDLCDFNVAYWEGDTAYAVIPKTIEQWSIIPGTNVERDPHESILPDEYKLENAYPNPFNPEARIKYDLKERSVVELEVFNAVGERVALLAEGTQPAGFYERTFRPTGASGVYLYRLTARSEESNETFVKTRKMIYLK